VVIPNHHSPNIWSLRDNLNEGTGGIDTHSGPFEIQNISFCAHLYGFTACHIRTEKSMGKFWSQELCM
jgi:hypothetical protein